MVSLSGIAEEAVKVRNAQKEIDAAIVAKGVTGGSGLGSAAERIAKIGGTAEHRYVVESSVKWTDEWAEKGKNGTIVDIEVGDEYAPRTWFSVGVTNTVASTKSTIDWGDGSVTETNANTSFTVFQHVYEAAGHYVVTVSDTARRVAFGRTGAGESIGIGSSTDTVWVANSARAVRRLRQFGSTLTDISYVLSSCRYCNCLGDYAVDLPPIPPNVTNLQCAFYSMRLYNGQMPYMGHLTKCTTAYYAYSYWASFTGDIQKLPPNITTADTAYGNMFSVKYIPYDVFPDSLANTLTNANQVFSNARVAEGEFPRIEHLVKLTSMSGTFNSCYRLGDGYGLPTLPAAPLTITSTMFSSCYAVTGDYPDLSSYDKLLTLNSMFNSCYHLTGSLPALPPSSYTSIGSLFFNNYSAQGPFPSIREDYTGDLSNFCNGCTNASGSLPAVPKGATNYGSMFAYCRSATGKVPDLTGVGTSSSLNASAFQSMFASCVRLTDPPEGFVAVNSRCTSFASMFSGCESLQSMPFDLSAYTSVTTLANTMSGCYMLLHGFTALPPNVTAVNSLFQQCNQLLDNMISPAGYAKLTTIGNMYYNCANIKPILASDGTVETDYTKIYSAKATSCSNAVYQAAPAVQKQIYNACVSAGVAGTKWGALATYKDWEE